MKPNVHYDNFVWDYYPLGIPLVIDDELERYVAGNLAKGTDGSVILADFHGIYLDEMERGTPRGTWIKSGLERSLDKSGVDCIAITLGNTSRPLHDLENILASIAWWKRFFRTFDRMEICLTPADAVKCRAAGKVGAIFCLQDGGCIGEDIDLVDRLYEDGVRAIQISFNKANAIGHGSTEPPEKGLTPFGMKVVERMNRLNMIVDLGHPNHRTTMDAIESSEKPVMVSHSSCKAVFDHGRAKADDVIEALAARNGFFGVLFVPSFISADPHPGFDVVIRHIRHAVSIMGMGGVGLASDWGLWSPDVPSNLTESMIQAAIKNLGLSKKMNLVAGTAPGKMKDYSDMYMATEALIGDGFSDKEAAGLIGGNFLDFWNRVVAG